MSGLGLVFGICVFTFPAVVFPNRFGVRLAVLLLCLISAVGGLAGGLVLGGPLWLLGLTVAICSWTSRRTARPRRRSASRPSRIAGTARCWSF